MASLKYNVVNKKPELFGNGIFSDMIRCLPSCVIEVIISPHVQLPFMHSFNSHNGSGSIAD